MVAVIVSIVINVFFLLLLSINPRDSEMAVSKTSLMAYWALRDAGELPEKERIVYEAVKRLGPMTREQIASVTSMKEGAVAGRVNSLVKRGMLVSHSVIINKVTLKPNEVLDLAAHRKQPQQSLFPELEAA
jgi:hypothetical protein